jgi:hypothetical protein
MDWTLLVWMAYAGIATFALVMTWREQARTRQQSIIYNAAGYAACALWPLALAAILVEARRRGV